jgi:hypothetical protein
MHCSFTFHHNNGLNNNNGLASQYMYTVLAFLPLQNMTEGMTYLKDNIPPDVPMLGDLVASQYKNMLW